MYGLELLTGCLVKNSISYLGWPTERDKLLFEKQEKKKKKKKSFLGRLSPSKHSKAEKKERKEKEDADKTAIVTYVPLQLSQFAAFVMYERMLVDVLFDHTALVIWDLKHIKKK